MFCPKCGKEVSDQARFCPKCGTPLSHAENDTPGGAVPASTDNPAEQVSTEQISTEQVPTGQISPRPPLVQTETTRTAVVDKPAEKKKNKALLAVIPIAAVLAVAVLFLLLPKRTDPSEDPPEADIPDRSQTEDIDPAQDETTDDVDPTQAANAELLSVIDRVEALVDKNTEELIELNDWDKDGDGMIDDIGLYAEDNRKGAQILDEFLVELEAMRAETEAISGLDDKMKGARDEYFNMLHAARAAHAEALTFYADYFVFFDDVVGWRPFEVDYDDLTEYAQDLSAWTQACRDGYAAISYPSCVESEWKQYGEILEYNGSIAQKLNQAIQYNDWLRYYSTQYMSSRYDTVEYNLYNKMLDCIDGEYRHVGYQLGYASDLAQEMHTYAELEPEKQEAYEFTSHEGKIRLYYDTVDTIYPSLYNTYDAFVIVKTGCYSGTRSIVVEAEIDGFTQKYSQSFNLNSSYKAIYIKPPALTGELDLTSAKSAQLRVTVSEKDGTLLETQTFPVTLKSKYDFEWYTADYGTSTQDDILCFLTPESPAVAELKRQAIDEIANITGNRMEAFVGYQEAVSGWNHYGITYVQAAGLMSALYKMGVRYNMNPFSISGSNQHILFPEDVIAQKSGLCIETSLAVASALQSAGMHAFLVFPTGHAQVAVEVWNSGEGKGEYFLIETTSLNGNINDRSHFIENGNNLLNYQASTGIITYYNSDDWADYLENSVEYLVDCDDSRLLGLTMFGN